MDSHFRGNGIWESGKDIWENRKYRKNKTGLINRTPAFFKDSERKGRKKMGLMN